MESLYERPRSSFVAALDEFLATDVHPAAIGTYLVLALTPAGRPPDR
jgi:hypothetical protein